MLRSAAQKGLEHFNLDNQPQISSANLHARAGCVLVAVRGDSLEHLHRTLQKTNLRRTSLSKLVIQS